MSLGLPSSAPLLDKVSGIASEAWQGWFRRVNRALLIADDTAVGDIIIYSGNNTGTGGGPPSTGTVTNTGTLTDHAVIVGNGGVDVSALSSLGTAGQVLTSQGTGADPQWATSAGGVKVSTVVLTNTQIKALPTTPITLVAAPGASFRLAPILIDVHGNFTAGAYTNVNADSWCYAEYSDVGVWSNFLANDSTIAYTFLSGVFAAAAVCSWQFVAYTVAEPIFQWGNLVFPLSATEANQSLRLTLFNSGSGNLTGGNAANTLTVTTLYTTVAI